MSTRTRATGGLLATVALASVLAGCGGSTVEGEAPEISTEAASDQTATSTPFAEERPVKPTGPVTPPPPSESAPPSEPPTGDEPPPEPAPEEPGDQPAPEPGAEPPPAPAPGGGDFQGLLQQRGVTLREGIDPVATATEACGRFDGGQQMVDVTGWLGEHTGLGPEQQGFFLGAAVGTYCPQNFPKLG